MQAMLTQASVKMLHAEVVNMTEDAKQSLLWRSAKFNENMAFYRGMQWGRQTTFGWYVQDQQEFEAREVYNYIRPTVRSWAAMMLRNVPNPQVVAGFSDQGTMVRASNTQRLVRSFQRNGTIPFETLYRAETKCAVHGAVWYKCYFDPNCGKAIRVPKYTIDEFGQPQPDVDEFGAQRWHTRFEGEIKVDFKDVIDVVVDPHATNDQEIRYVVERMMVPVSRMDDWFPYDAFGMPTRGRWDCDSREVEMHERDAIENEHRAYDASIGGIWSGRAESNQLVRMYAFWMRPTNHHPEGMILVWSGDVIVAISKLPYEWPWVLRNGSNIVPNSLYADGVVEDLKAIQRTINLNASKRREWIDIILSPPMLVPSTAGLTKDLLTDIAGEILSYDPIGGKPEWMTVPNIPQTMFTQEDHLVAILKDVSAISDISRGEAPPGIETGRALAYLHEFQQGVHEPDVRMFQEAMKKVITKCLKLARDFYQEDRLVKMIGLNNAWELQAFKRDDYDFESELEIETNSGAPNSRALRLAEAIEIMQIGGYSDTPEAQRFRKIASIDYQDRDTLDWNEVHKSNARREQFELVANPMAWPMVHEADNHESHLDLHNDFRVSAEYKALSPMAQQAFDQHVAEHEWWFTQQQLAYSGQMGMMGSGPTGAPPAKQKQLPSPRDGGGGMYPATESVDGNQKGQLPAPAMAA